MRCRVDDFCGDIEEGIHVNCGGPELVDLAGRTWSEDSLLSPSPHLTGPNANTAVFAGAPDLSFDPFIGEREYPDTIFTTERWNNGPIEYTFTGLPNGKYEVALLFMEGCCSAGCEHEPAGRPCDDEGACTTADACDGTGRCVGAEAPSADCRTSRRGALTLHRGNRPTKDRLAWTWARGTTSEDEFGDPVSGRTSYQLCIYDGRGVVLQARVRGGRQCGQRSCWVRRS